MHRGSYKIAKNFINKYVPDAELKIADIGSKVIEGQKRSYRQLCTNEKWYYIGVFIQEEEWNLTQSTK